MDKDKCNCDCGCNCEVGEGKKWWKHGKMWHKGGGHGHLYGLGVLGALFYFLSSATSFTSVVVGIFKAIFWPALVVFKALELLKF